MSLMQVEKTEYANRAETPGKTVALEARDAIRFRTIEMMHPPGVISGPTPGDVVVTVDAGGRLVIAVGSRNYRIEVAVTAGETVIYSTAADGSEVKAEIKLDTDGKIEAKNASQSLKDLIDSLIDEIKNLTTYGSPGSHSVTAASKATLDLLKADFGELLK